MQPWPIPLQSDFRLPLSADARHTSVDFLNDITWELAVGGGGVPALVVQTTAGLRLRSLRFFPRILNGPVTCSDPREFRTAPRLTRLSPGMVSLTAEVLPNLECMMDVCVCASQGISGRLSWRNSGEAALDFTLEWVGLLSPMGEGAPMAAQSFGMNTALSGRSGELHPVCFLSGGVYAGEGVFPALAVDVHLEAGETQAFAWACALLGSQAESFERAREETNRAWDAQIARIEMDDSATLLDVDSGDAEWDFAFRLAQREAQRLIMPGEALPFPSFVLSRQPDQGFSFNGSGRDYPPAWSGQTALDALWITGLLVPGRRDTALGMLRNFLAVQTDDGSMDWRPGLAGQRSRHLAQPVLAGLASRLIGESPGALRLDEFYPGLLRFNDRWYAPQSDRDSDGIPEWEHAVQTGLEDAPVYDRWNPQGQGADIRSLHAPGLMAMLLRENRCLADMARSLKREEDAQCLDSRSLVLQQALDECWDEAAGTFRYRDAQTHLSPGALTIAEMDAPGTLRVRKSLSMARRLLLRVEAAPGERTRPLVVTIFGQSPDGAVEEKIPAARIHWAQNVGRFTTRNVFIQVEQVQVAGLPPGDRLTVMGVDATSEDISLLLPLWAGVCSPQQAAVIVERSLPRLMGRFGLRLWPENRAVHVGWNQIIGEGLINARQEPMAASILQGVMSAVAPFAARSGRFAEAYDSDNGSPMGESAALHGLAPLALFLQVLGIQQIGMNLVVWRGKSFFPRSVKLQYRGMKIIIDSGQARVVFTNGQQVTVNGPGTQRIFLG